MVLKFYWLPDGPPSLAVKQALDYLQMSYELIPVDYSTLEHRTPEFDQKNPQKEIPVLDDDGFYLSESNAIMQYICDRYKPDSELYPKDPKARAIVNQRLCFNLSFIYPQVLYYAVYPMFFDYERTSLGLKKLHLSLDAFNTYLKRAGTKYVAADHLTIADFPLVNTIMPLEAMDFDISQYKEIQKWYQTFKNEFPKLWEISEGGLKILKGVVANPPDLSNMNHPFHPPRKPNK